MTQIDVLQKQIEKKQEELRQLKAESNLATEQFERCDSQTTLAIESFRENLRNELLAELDEFLDNALCDIAVESLNKRANSSLLIERKFYLKNKVFEESRIVGAQVRMLGVLTDADVACSRRLNRCKDELNTLKLQLNEAIKARPALMKAADEYDQASAEPDPIDEETAQRAREARDDDDG